MMQRILGRDSAPSALLGGYAVWARDVITPEVDRERIVKLTRAADEVERSDPALAAALLVEAVDSIYDHERASPVLDRSSVLLGRAASVPGVPGGDEWAFVIWTRHEAACARTSRSEGAETQLEAAFAALAISREGPLPSEAHDVRDVIRIAIATGQCRRALERLGRVPEETRPEHVCATAVVAIEEKRLDDARKLLADAERAARGRLDPPKSFAEILRLARDRLAAAER